MSAQPVEKAHAVEQIEDSHRPATLDPPLREFSDAESRKLYRRIDIRLLPILALLYLLSFLDRGNIGNARLAGLESDLDMSSSEYNLALSLFFLSYVIFEIPANLVMKVLRPHVWLASITAIWGIIMTCMGVVQGKAGLYVTRFLLGMFEAGLYPGVIFYLSIWYPRYMFQFRAALFFGSATIAGSFSGLLAYGISFMQGIGGYGGWRWIFIIEGLMTVAAGILAFFVIVDYAKDAKFLSEEEKSWVVWKQASGASQYGEAEHLSLQFIKDALWNWHTIINTFTHMCAIIPLYGIALFMPTIINAFGRYSRPEVQLLTVPVYAFACIWVIACGFLADRYHTRYPFAMGNLALICFGYVLNIPIGVKYFGLFPAAAGAYAVQPTMIAWLSNNLSGQTKRGVGIAFEIGISGAGALVPSNIYFARDGPNFYMGHGIILGFAFTGLFSASLYAFLLKRENARRALYMQTPEFERRVYTVQEIQAMGDKHPAYVYTI